jgi:FdhD protein
VREQHENGWASHEAPDAVSEELPIALVYNDISHAVMMATPADLEDFAVGFSLTEGIIGKPGDIFDFEEQDHGEAGIELHLHIHGRCMDQLQRRRRSLVGATGCGICGRESLEQVRPDLPHAAPSALPSAATIQSALTRLDERQRLQQLTGTIHAACWCLEDGAIAMLREDVGRHNALDKLIGALARNTVNTEHGFALVSSRGSYEMVAKAAQARLGTLVTISGVTAMAIRMAEQAGLNLIGFARRGRQVVYVNSAAS